MDSSSGRNNLNSGSDSAVHHKGTAQQQYDRTPKATPAPAPTAEVVRDLKPTPVAGSLVK